MANEGGKEQGIKAIIDSLSTTVSDAFHRAESQLGVLTGKKSFAVDVVEYPDSYLIVANLPGVRKEDLDVALEMGKLVIRVTAGSEDALGEGTYLYRERTSCGGTRSVDLVDAADSESIQASLKDGVLRVRLAKTPRKQAKKVNID